MTEKKMTFEDALTELVKQTPGATCVICESPNRAAIEVARKRGVPFTKLGIALQMSGQLPPNISKDAAGRRVSAHFTGNHTKGTS